MLAAGILGSTAALNGHTAGGLAEQFTIMPDPSLNIRSEITRIRGVAQQPQQAQQRAGLGNSSQHSGNSSEQFAQNNSALIGPVPPTQLLANALSAIQDFGNTIGLRVVALAAQIAAIGNISAKAGTIAFSGCTVTVTVDEAGNLLVFSVRYASGVVKTGTVALV